MIVAGGKELTLTAIDVAQMVTVAGSLKASITEAWAITSSGEFAMNARYAAAQ